MRRIATLLAGTTFLALASPAFAQDDTAVAAQPAEESGADPADDQNVVVTARRRSEALQDVPVALTAVSGESIERRGLTSVREVAQQVPGLNINSDGSGRAFVAIRGVGVTLVQSVQPGVGLFVDGIYRPNTAYLNNPLLDVQRIEVLRGPQGTLYGKNTLGGAINVVTRQPGNETEVRGLASYAGPDDSWLVSGSLTLPVITDRLTIRIAGAHREQDGFLTNTVVGGHQNRLVTDSLNATVRATPADGLVLTFNGYYDWIEGANTPYSRVTGPRDYSRNVQFNALNRADYDYFGINGKAEIALESINSNLTLMAAYDGRNTSATDSDVDFGPANIARAFGSDRLRTHTLELRLDSELTGTVSTMFGLFYSRETSSLVDNTNIIPLGLTRVTTSQSEADTYSAFGTIFWRPDGDWEVALGLRYDHEDRLAQGSITLFQAGLTVPLPVPDAQIKSDQVEPRLTVTRRWTPNFMSYASVSRGYRGGGFNAPTAPTRTYQGDSAWTYEFGTRWRSADNRFSLSGAIFYSDYKDYIGLNSVAPATGGGLVTVDLNTGDVRSYGFELEAVFRPTRRWTITGALGYTHARLTDTTAYTATTGRVLASDRLTFQPDYTFSLNSDYVIPFGEDELTLTLGATGKGRRLAATLNQTMPTFLDSYVLVNAQVSYRHGPLEFSLFANNLFNEDYFESYIERTTLQLAGLPASDLGIVGDRARYGARVRFNF
jgi:iron complex outermembrane recepter protein